MKLRAILLCGALSAATLPAADTLIEEFQRALFEEEANRNLPAAIAGYEAVVKRLDEQRQLAATAVFRMGESYRKLGKTNEAVSAYERIIREFADQGTLVKLSGQNLSILKPKDSESPATNDARLSRLLDRRNQMQANLQQLRNQYSDEHPWVRQAMNDGQVLDSQIQQLMSLGAGQPASAELGELRRLEILLETVRSLEPMSDAELRTLLEFANDDEAAQGLKTWRNWRTDLERLRSDLRNRPEDKTVAERVQFHERLVQDGEAWWSEWRAATLRMLEARVEAARRLAARGDTVGAANAGSNENSMTAEEAEELRRVQALAANSPDLINKREKAGLPPLHLAIQRGHLNVVRFLLANGASPSVADANGWTPLYLAALRGQLSALRVLLESGISVDQPLPESGMRALHAATESGNNAVISFLLAEGANVNAKDKEGRTALHIAAARGLTNAIELLIPGHADLEASALRQSENNNINGTTIYYNYDGTPLNFAIAKLQFAAAAMLLEKGANPNPETGLVSPLWLAVKIGNTNFVHWLIQAGSVTTNEPLIELAIERMPAEIPFLLEAGADPNAVSGPQQQPPLFTAAQRYANQWWANRPAGASGGSGRGAPGLPPVQPGVALPPTLIHGGQSQADPASTVNWENVVKSLVAHGADLKAVHKRRSVLMSLIAQQGSSPMAMIDWLLEQGADPNLGGGSTASGGFIQTPLNSACLGGNVELARLLIKHGAKLDSREEGDSGTTPLRVAVGMKHVELVKLLLENGANPNAVGTDERTPLMGLLDKYIVPGGNGMSGPFGSVKDGQFMGPVSKIPELELAILEITRLLLGKGGRLNAELAEGFTPMHFAAAAKDRRFLELFLEFKTNPNTTNAVGVTPLHTAAAMNQSENIRLLVQSGADVNLADQNGDTPLHIAALLNRVPASEVLLELGADRERKNRFGRNPVENLSDVKLNKWPPFGLPEYLDPIKNVTDVLGR